MFNNHFIFSRIKFLIFFYKKKLLFEFESGTCQDQGYPIPNGYEDGIINFNPSSTGYRYGDMLGSRGRGDNNLMWYCIKH